MTNAMISEVGVFEEFDVVAGVGIDFRPEDSPYIVTLMMQRRQIPLVLRRRSHRGETNNAAQTRPCLAASTNIENASANLELYR